MRRIQKTYLKRVLIAFSVCLLLAVIPLILHQRFTRTLPVPAHAEERQAELLSDRHTVRYEKVVDGLENPWGMVFLPDGRILVTEKRGEIRIIENNRLLEETITGLPPVQVLGQGGLLDIELHPDFEENGWLYLTYAHSGVNGSNTSLMRGRLVGTALKNTEVLYKATPDSTEKQHFGSRIEFDREGYLYFSIGDRGNRQQNPQDLTRDGGKIYRLHDDGTVPETNPFVKTDNAIPAIYSYGHRNPQGLALQPSTGILWQHEHGPQGGDEINIIRAGKNYGWPVITYGVNYGGAPITEEVARKGMQQPVQFWTPSIAPCGMTFISGEKYPGWRGDMLVGSLKFNYLVRLAMRGETILQQEIIASGIGRVRNVKEAPDGTVYVAVEGEGLFRLLPSGAISPHVSNQ